MAIDLSRLSEYLVRGNPEGLHVSRLSQYVTQGGDQRLYTSRITQYVVSGPPVIIPAAPRRRQIIMS